MRGIALMRRLAAVATLMVALPGGAVAAVLALSSGKARWKTEAGPFPVGNLLSYANSDFEGHVNFVSIRNAALEDSATAFLHFRSLRDTVRHAGSSVFALPLHEAIRVHGSSTYTISAYVKLSSEAPGQGMRFALHCYTSTGSSLGQVQVLTQPARENSWQYVQGQMTLPAGCRDVVSSPKVTLTGMSAGESAYLDEMTLRPYRAALVIGAHGNVADGRSPRYTARDWLDTDKLLGPLQSDKTFYDADHQVPLHWWYPTNNCYEIERALPAATWPECVITYKKQEPERRLRSFLAGLPARQEVVMVWYQEPEAAHFAGCARARGDGPNFVCYFERQTDRIRKAAAADRVTPEVLVGMDAGAYHYPPGAGCSFIPPSRYVDVYLIDHYAHDSTGNLAVGSGNPPATWLTWLGCVLPQNKPIGLAEFGVDPNDSNPSGTAAAISADTTYLATLPQSVHEEVALWELWDSSAYASDSTWAIDNEPAAVQAWKAAETENHGG